MPQGSVLGPSLFVIFINDLPDKIKDRVKIYADDTKIYGAASTDEQIEANNSKGSPACLRVVEKMADVVQH